MWSRTSRRGLESETSAPREREPRQTGGEGWRSCVSHGLPITVATACAPKPDHRPAATTPPPDRTELLRRTRVRKADLLPDCDGVLTTAIAPTELRSFEDDGRPESVADSVSLGVRASTRQLIAHSATPAEAAGDEVRHVDTVVVGDQLDHVVGEVQV